MVDEGAYSGAFPLHDISENCKRLSKNAHKVTQNIGLKSVRKLPKTLPQNFPRNQRIVNRIKISLAKVLEEAFQFIELADKKENLRIGFKGLSWSKKYT